MVVDGTEDGLTLKVALIQRSVSARVRAGENSGRHLEYAHVVRAFKRLSLGSRPDGLTGLYMPGDVKPEELDVVANVQDEDLNVLGATRTLPTEGMN